MVLLVGQVGRAACVDREAFQEVDYRRMFGRMRSSGSAQVDRRRAHPRARRAGVLDGALGPARAGRAGAARGHARRTSSTVRRRAARRRGAAAPRRRAARAHARAARRRAERPLAIVGGGGWTRRRPPTCRAFAEASDMPVAASFRCQDIVDNRLARLRRRRRASASTRRSRARVREAESLLVVGARLGEIDDLAATRCSTCPVPQPAARARPPGRRGARARLPPGARRSSRGMPQFAAALARARAGRREPRCAELDARRPAPTTSRTASRPGAAATASTWARSCAPAPTRCPTTRSSPTAPATTRSGCTASARYRDYRTAARADSAARWATACRPRSPAKLAAPERTVVCVRRRRLTS